MPVLQLVYICKFTYLLKILSVLFKLYTSKPYNDQPHTSPKIKAFYFDLRDVKIYRKICNYEISDTICLLKICMFYQTNFVGIFCCYLFE